MQPGNLVEEPSFPLKNRLGPRHDAPALLALCSQLLGITAAGRARAGVCAVGRRVVRARPAALVVL